MPRPSEFDPHSQNSCATKICHRRGRETTSPAAARTTRAWPGRSAPYCDAGLKPSDVDGMMFPNRAGDSDLRAVVAGASAYGFTYSHDVSARLVDRGVAAAIGRIEAGMCKDRGDLPSHERDLRCASPAPEHGRRHVSGECCIRVLRLAARPARLRITLHAPLHDYVHEPRGRSPRQGDTKRARSNNPRTMYQRFPCGLVNSGSSSRR